MRKFNFWRRGECGAVVVVFCYIWRFFFFIYLIGFIFIVVVSDVVVIEIFDWTIHNMRVIYWFVRKKWPSKMWNKNYLILISFVKHLGLNLVRLLII